MASEPSRGPAPGVGPTRVSVLMPMRNPGRFVEDAVRSILDQGVAELELLIIDDGSTDGSREYVEGLADPRIHVVEGPRSGISACMNRGLELAGGDVVMRCDSDDAYPPGRIAQQLEFLQRHPDFVGVCGPFSVTGPGGEHVGSPRIAPQSGGDDVSGDILASKLRTHLCAFAFRRDVLSRIGLFRPFFQTAEDIDFQLRLAAAGPVGFLPATAYVYRLHDASITHTQASTLRQFFEATAYAMARERAATGSDALMRGETVALPELSADAHRPDRSARQISQLLVGEAWRRFLARDRPGALHTAWRAVVASPGHAEAWRSLLLVGIKPHR